MTDGETALRGTIESNTLPSMEVRMAIEDDVLVIGGGLAGITAALSAAEFGGRVRLLSHKESTLRQASGLIDVLGYPEASDADAATTTKGPVVDPFEAISELPKGHPYERVGAETVREALLFFDAIAGDAYRGGHTDANALVPTVGGSVKPTARYPASVAPGLASTRRETLLVGFESLVGFDAPRSAADLRDARVPFGVRGVTIRFPGELRDDAKVTRYARVLDHDESVEGVRSRATLAEAVRPHLEGEERIGFPAVLGEENPAVVRRDFEERLGCEVFEVPMGPPSVLGMRLQGLLEEALADAGVRVTTGVPVVGSEGDGAGGIDRVLVDRKGRETPYRAESYVLATGGLVGKGIRSEREAVPGEEAREDPPSHGSGERDGSPAYRSDLDTDEATDDPSEVPERRSGRVFEPIFDCHVPHSEDRTAWYADRAFGDHPFARFGLEVDRELRPLDGSGDVEFANLWAAGAVLGNYDYAAECSGSGVSLATGLHAGRRAGEEVSQ